MRATSSRKAEISYGTIGPSLYNFAKLRGYTPDMQKYAWGKVYNAQAYTACSNMPRFGHNGILTEQQMQGCGRAADGSGVAGEQVAMSRQRRRTFLATLVAAAVLARSCACSPPLPPRAPLDRAQALDRRRRVLRRARRSAT